MSRYFVRARGYVEDDVWATEPGRIPDICVPEHEATNTGLLDVNGSAIMRAPNPMGFGKDGEW